VNGGGIRSEKMDTSMKSKNEIEGAHNEEVLMKVLLYDTYLV